MESDVITLPTFKSGPLILDDLWTRERFAQERPSLLPQIMALKKQRRLFLGPHATLLFESKLLVWWQIQEMLRVEDKAEPQEEIEAYADLVPQKQHLCATLFLEYPNPIERAEALSQLFGIDTMVSLCFQGQKVCALPQGPKKERASAVTFLSFPFSVEAFRLFCLSFSEIVVSIGHPRYQHTASIEKPLWEALRQDVQE